jgi:sulfur-oxidizing protein SoxZ
MAAVRISVPAQARRGEVIEIRTLVQHPMETGFRRTHLGEPIARNIIRSFVCTYDGEEVFRADFHPALAANPYLSFTVTATQSATLRFTWTGDNGFMVSESAQITVV